MVYYKSLKYKYYKIIVAPYDEPSLSLDFDKSCAHLTIQDPTEPNGIIIAYQVN